MSTCQLVNQSIYRSIFLLVLVIARNARLTCPYKKIVNKKYTISLIQNHAKTREKKHRLEQQEENGHP